MPGGGGGAALGARLRFGDVSRRRCRRNCGRPDVPSPGRRRRRRECRWGRSPRRDTAPSASLTGPRPGCSMPALGSCSTSTSLASPQVLPVSASQVGAAHRPGRVLVGHRRVSAKAPRRTPAAHAAIANGRWRIRRQPRRSLGGRRRHGRRSGTRRPAAAPAPTGRAASVVNPKCHSGNGFDHGTPKLETYHQPLTLANDSAHDEQHHGGEQGPVAPRAHRRAR